MHAQRNLFAAQPVLLPQIKMLCIPYLLCLLSVQSFVSLCSCMLSYTLRPSKAAWVRVQAWWPQLCLLHCRLHSLPLMRGLGVLSANLMRSWRLKRWPACRTSRLEPSSWLPLPLPCCHCITFYACGSRTDANYSGAAQTCQ